MQLTKADQITIADRQRKTFDTEAIAKLATSILDKGLLHPLVLRKDNGEHVLIAGERRFRAIQLIAAQQRYFKCNGVDVPPGSIPYILVTDLDDIKYREAELEENILREDLTWQEETNAIEELHRLRQAQHAKQTKRDTAREITAGDSTKLATMERRVARALVIAPHLEDPEVQKARNEKEAFNIVARQLEANFRDNLSMITQRTSQHTLIHGDANKEMSSLAAHRFSVVIADPPYGIGADQFGDAAQLSHEYEDTPGVAFAFAEAIIASADKYTADAHLYLFCDIEFFGSFKLLCKDYGWQPRNAPLIWEKGSMGHLASGTVYGWRRCYELILFATRGNRQLNSLSDDVLRGHSFTENEKTHAAQKPVSLYKRLLQLSAQPGDHVLDPCCGSGTIFEAADGLRLMATGIELSETAYQLAKARLNSLTEV